MGHEKSILVGKFPDQNAHLVVLMEKDAQTGGHRAPRAGARQWRMEEETMLNKETLQDAARTKFRVLILDRVIYIASRCWPMNIEFKLKEISAIIEAAKTMGATEAQALTFERISELVGDLTALRTLEMKAEAYAHLREAMKVLGIEFLPPELKFED